MTAFWLRWWNQSETLLLRGSEQIDQERQRAEQARQRAEQAEEQLVQVARFRDGSLREAILAQGMTNSQVAELVGLSVAQVEERRWAFTSDRATTICLTMPTTLHHPSPLRIAVAPCGGRSRAVVKVVGATPAPVVLCNPIRVRLFSGKRLQRSGYLLV